MRRALEYAVDKAAIVQVRGGPLLARPLHQVGVEGSAGFRRGYAPYATATNHGDPDRARQLLHSAGLGPYDTLRNLLANSYGREIIALQEALRKAGVAAVIVRTSGSDDYYNNYLLKPEATRRGDWDIALNDFFPDWWGINNGRASIQTRFDGRRAESKRSAGSFSSPLAIAAATCGGTDFRSDVTIGAGTVMIFMMICCAEPPRCGGCPASISKSTLASE